MKEKINNLPLPVVIIAAIALLGLAGWAISSRIQSDNGSYTGNMDRNRYMAEMKRQMSGGQGGGSQYSASGQMQSRGAGGAPGGGSMQRQMMNRGGGGYGQMQGGGPGGGMPPGGMPGGPMGR
ncbi:MAG: hypothetical protein ACKO14_07690 [Armatimonadota bacterium]